jgi:hypothetical protein
MRQSLSGLFRGRRTAERRATHRGTSFRPVVEGLEDRVVLSAAATLGPPALAPALARAAAPAGPTGQQLVTQAMNLNITGITAQAGQLVASGTVGALPFTAPLTLTASPNAADPTCPILHLRLNAIHLNLLGLKVDTSNICLDITAQSGPGNLLGNLLCNVANLLNSGTPLSTILNGLSATDLTTLTSGLTGLLNGAAGQLAGSPAAAPQATPGTCDILHLSLGPVNLNLLGLVVHLDNCANGPVTVDVTAQSGPGNLLGNLLCGITHLLDTPASASAIGAHLNHLLRDIGRLL